MTRIPKAVPFFVLLLSVAGLSGTSFARQAPAAASETFLWISDIHLDPFYFAHRSDAALVRQMLEQMVDRTSPNNPRWKDHAAWGPILAGSAPQGNDYNSRGTDTNDRLLQAALAHARNVSPAPDFVMITGDLLGHDFGSNYASLAPGDMQTGVHYNTFVDQTLKYIAMSVRKRVAAGIPIYATLGNNDAYCGDYDIRLDHPNSTFLEDTADTFLRYFLPDLTPAEQQDFRATFQLGGFYAAALPGGSANRVLVLNSIPFMGSGSYPETWGAYYQTKASCTSSNTVSAADQMKWFKNEAGNAPAGHALVAAHVPPGMACYDGSPMWSATNLASYMESFLDGGTALKLAGTLAAHSHMASFKLLRGAYGNAVSFVLQAPSISPNHKNNPSFRVVTYDSATLEISDYRTHYLDLNTGHWRSFSFRESYGQHPVTAATLDSLYTDMQASTTTWDLFVQNYGSSAEAYVGLGSLSQTNRACLGSLTGK